MTNPPTLVLTVKDLCSRYGFNEGEVPDDLRDYWYDMGVDPESVDWHAVLRRIVREQLVPAVEAAGHTIEVHDTDPRGGHNPIQAWRVDGVEVDDLVDMGVTGWVDDLHVEPVTVPYAVIAETCGLTAVP